MPTINKRKISMTGLEKTCPIKRKPFPTRPLSLQVAVPWVALGQPGFLSIDGELEIAKSPTNATYSNNQPPPNKPPNHRQEDEDNGMHAEIEIWN